MSKGRFRFKQFNQKFPDDDACLEHMFYLLYSNIKDFDKYYRVRGRKCFAHSQTGEQIHPLAGTIFHKSRTPLRDWFYIIFLFSCASNGISSYEISRQIGVTHKCAWRMGKQIRELFKTSNYFKKLEGTVEVDETYIGGKAKGKRGRGAANKTAVVRTVQRQGEVRATVTANTKSNTIMSLIKDNIAIGSKIMTDKYRSYTSVKRFGYNRARVNHGQEQFVDGENHTNTIEGVWSQMKRAIDGTHYMVSSKYLQDYVDEFTWKYNRAKSHVHLFEELIVKFKNK